MGNKFQEILEDLKKNGKICSCGKKYYYLPISAVFTDDGPLTGFWWHCTCKSTLLKKAPLKPSHHGDDH